MTAAERAAWAAAGALATLAALAGLAVHWGRAVERNEQYGTWQGQHHVAGEQGWRTGWSVSTVRLPRVSQSLGAGEQAALDEWKRRNGYS